MLCFLKELGLGEIGLQNELTPEIFVTTILAMLKNLDKYQLKEKVLIIDAAEKIVEVFKRCYKEKGYLKKIKAKYWLKLTLILFAVYVIFLIAVIGLIYYLNFVKVSLISPLAQNKIIKNIFC